MYMLLDSLLDSPIIISIIAAILMILDMKLTQKGYAVAQEGYNDHFETPHYEMNPRYQELIHDQKDLPKRTYLARISIAGALGVLVYIIRLPFFNETRAISEKIIEFVVGGFLLLYLMINLNHLTNLYTFRYIRNHPEAIEGSLKMNEKYSYATTRRNYFNFIIIWIVVYILTGRLFFFGGVVEQIILIFFSYRWEEKS